MLNKMMSQTYPQPAWTLLRIACGLFFVPHLWFKLSNLAGAYALFGKMGFPEPAIFVWLAIASESIAAAGLIFNKFVRYTALLGAGALFVAIFGLYNLKGDFFWLWNLGGIEFPIFWGLTCVAVALSNAGQRIKQADEVGVQ